MPRASASRHARSAANAFPGQGTPCRSLCDHVTVPGAFQKVLAERPVEICQLGRRDHTRTISPHAPCHARLGRGDCDAGNRNGPRGSRIVNAPQRQCREPVPGSKSCVRRGRKAVAICVTARASTSGTSMPACDGEGSCASRGAASDNTNHAFPRCPSPTRRQQSPSSRGAAIRARDRKKHVSERKRQQRGKTLKLDAGRAPSSVRGSAIGCRAPTHPARRSGHAVTAPASGRDPGSSERLWSSESDHFSIRFDAGTRMRSPSDSKLGGSSQGRNGRESAAGPGGPNFGFYTPASGRIACPPSTEGLPRLGLAAAADDTLRRRRRAITGPEAACTGADGPPNR